MKIVLTEKQIKTLIRENLDELNYQSLQDDENLQDLRDAIDKNKLVSVAFVKKDGTVKHMLIRRNLSSYVGSDREKTDAQMNVEMNHDLKKVVDVNAYKREMKYLRGENPEMDMDTIKQMASKKAWRSVNLRNVLGFMVGGRFIDLRDENEIMDRFGEQVHSQLTKSMINAMAPVENNPDAVEGDVNEQQPISSQSVDLKKITQILTSLGFKNTPHSGYRLHMDKPNNGPVKDKSGKYVASYEAYIPLKQDGGFGFTDGKTPQLWIDQRSGLKPGVDEPNTYNSIFDLNPNGVILQNVKNGKIIAKTKLSLENFYNTLQSYLNTNSLKGDINEDIYDNVKLRKLTFRSKWDFSPKHQGWSIEDVMKFNPKSLLWAYLNLEKISFVDEVLDVLQEKYPTLKRIEKPGVDKGQFDSVADYKNPWLKFTYNELKKIVAAKKINGEFIPKPLLNQLQKKKIEFQKEKHDANFDFTNVDSKIALQRKNHGHDVNEQGILGTLRNMVSPSIKVIKSVRNVANDLKHIRPEAKLLMNRYGVLQNTKVVRQIMDPVIDTLPIIGHEFSKLKGQFVQGASPATIGKFKNGINDTYKNLQTQLKVAEGGTLNLPYAYQEAEELLYYIKRIKDEKVLLPSGVKIVNSVELQIKNTMSQIELALSKIATTK